LRTSLDKKQRRMILMALTGRVVPWINDVNRLMDFLTGSFEEGGDTSLLALSGLFHLMQERNLDYPDFYRKLYSLLDGDILRSKHRERFFVLLDVFLSSSHLPAQLVASFIKRLARLALHAPPGAITIVIPWIYNTLKSHPQCTFMIHRERMESSNKRKLESAALEDPFDMLQENPMETDAIESSLWEVETLQSYYYPSVATLAKVISEPFRKQSYNLDDFLGHTYNSVSLFIA
jgi:U3 small nucleolar RNA-associated protein 19